MKQQTFAACMCLALAPQVALAQIDTSTTPPMSNEELTQAFTALERVQKVYQVKLDEAASMVAANEQKITSVDNGTNESLLQDEVYVTDTTENITYLNDMLNQNVDKTDENTTAIANLLGRASAGLVYDYYYSNDWILDLKPWEKNLNPWQRGFRPDIRFPLEPGYLVETIVEAKSFNGNECQFGIQDFLYDGNDQFRIPIKHAIAGAEHHGKRLTFMSSFQYEGPAEPDVTTKRWYRIQLHNNDSEAAPCAPRFFHGKLQFNVKIYDNSAGLIQTDLTNDGLWLWD